MALLPVELSDDLFAFRIGKLEVGELLKTSVLDFSWDITDCLCPSILMKEFNQLLVENWNEK